MPAFVRALFIKSSTNVELSYYMKKSLPLQTIPLQVRDSSLIMCVCKILAYYFCSSSHAMICLLFSYPITFRSVMKIGFSKSAKVTELMLLNLLASQRT